MNFPVFLFPLFVRLRARIRGEAGATAVEYGIMIALIAAVILLAVVFLGHQTSDAFRCTAQAIKNKAGGC